MLTLTNAAFLLHHTGTHEWQRFRTPQEMTSAMKSAGLVVSKPTGIIFDLAKLLPPTSPDAWVLSETDTDVNYILHATRGGASAPSDRS